jgi:Fe-S-cluster-containing dehydrogenase component/DMSO reductase anchor subunit
MIEVRKNEPDYALLNDPDSQSQNRYGKSIDTVSEGDPLHGKSLNINGDSSVGENPNRYKQHGFYFNADNCIACHACEAAFRSVGFVEGGTYPAYQRLNISMACNHCDNPVCLKGCPTRAYTKFAEYGAVLQDPDICFGCGYCTWVCPYNAPQLDPVKGQVSKCNMCVDRLEVGLKPACVSACLGKALDFGVVENIPEGRTQAKTEIPGFPSTDITHPNIRFQQTRTTQRDMVRVDSTAVKYHREDGQGEEGNRFKPVLDPKHGFQRQWNLKKLLSSHENAHIAFTLASQTVMGAFLLLFLGSFAGATALPDITASSSTVYLLGTMLLIQIVGLVKLNLHLGKPMRFYRGFNNLRHSPVSREIAGVSLFFGGLAGYAFFSVFAGMFTNILSGELVAMLTDFAGYVALTGLVLGSWYMYKLYRIPARPFWDHWQTASAFWGNTLSLGALLITLIICLTSGLGNNQGLIQSMALVALAGLAMEAIGHLFHGRDMQRQGGEGAASHYEQTTTYGYSYRLRNALLAINLMTLGVVAMNGLSGSIGMVTGVALTFSILATSIISRALFYVLVIPTTMPGAFFWRNKGFEEHARETGLAEMPQVGVVPNGH